MQRPKGKKSRRAHQAQRIRQGLRVSVAATGIGPKLRMGTRYRQPVDERSHRHGQWLAPELAPKGVHALVDFFIVEPVKTCEAYVTSEALDRPTLCAQHRFERFILP